MRKVDHSAIRTNQAFIVGLLLLGFILNLWPLVGLVGLVLGLGTIVPALSLFKRVYLNILKPAGIVQPDIHIDNPEPHQFSQGVGAVFTLGASAALLFGAATVGWVLAWIVIVLASINLVAGFCAGCFVYYQLNRLGVPGFEHAPVRE